MSQKLFSYIALLFFVLLSFVNKSSAEDCAKDSSEHHPLCKVFEVVKSGARCEFSAEENFKYKADILCNSLKTFAYKRETGTLQNLLAEGFEFQKEKHEPYLESLLQRKQQLETRFKEVEVLRKTLRSFKEDQTPMDAAFKSQIQDFHNKYDKKIDLTQDDDDLKYAVKSAFDSTQEELKFLKDLVALAAKNETPYPGIVRAKCKELVAKSNLSSHFEDTCLFGYDYLRTHFNELPQGPSQTPPPTRAGTPERSPTQERHSELCAPTSGTEVARQAEIYLRLQEQVRSHLNPLEGKGDQIKAEHQAKNTVKFLYGKNAGKLHLSSPDPSLLQNLLTPIWKEIALKAENLLKDGVTAPWEDISIHGSTNSLLQNENKDVAQFFPHTLRVLPDGTILGLFAGAHHQLGKGGEREVTEGFVFSRPAGQNRRVGAAEEGESAPLANLLAIGHVNGTGGLETTKRLRTIYAQQNALALEKGSPVLPPPILVEGKTDLDLFMYEEKYDGTWGDLKPGDPAITLEVVRDVLHQVAFLNEHKPKKYVHQDLKPQNILFRKDEKGRITAKIADFGQMKALAEADGRGSPMWMPPEWSEDTNHLAEKWDAWPLGLTLYSAKYAHKYHPRDGKTYEGCVDTAQFGRGSHLTFPMNVAKLKKSELKEGREYQAACEVCGIFCDEKGQAKTPPGSDQEPTEEYIIWRMLHPDPAKRISVPQAYQMVNKIRN